MVILGGSDSFKRGNTGDNVGSVALLFDVFVISNWARITESGMSTYSRMVDEYKWLFILC